jgi:type III secretory pathway lipoprotein EscJ
MIGRCRCYGRDWLSGGSKGSGTGRGSFISIFSVIAVLFLTGCQEQIVHDLSERDANRVISHLSEARLHPRKVQQPDGRWAISVARDEVVPALGYLDSRRVLVTRDSTAVASKGTIIPSREEQWFRYERSMAHSIEESLSTLPGVLEARVHLNLPDEDPLFGDGTQRGGSGSVLLVVDARFSAGEGEVAAVVSGAAGIKPELVRVLTSTTSESTVSPLIETAQLTSVSSVPEIKQFVRADLCVAGAVILGGVLGVRRLRGRSKKKVKFEAPKELDFEG